jgi:hypothetical protein
MGNTWARVEACDLQSRKIQVLQAPYDPPGTCEIVYEFQGQERLVQMPCDQVSINYLDQNHGSNSGKR